MSVALKKIDGISSVNVTLKRGVAHIGLEQGNAVSLPQLRQVIKDAGYATREAVVTARGTVLRRRDRLVLDVTGTSTSLVLAPDPATPAAFTALETSAAPGQMRVEIVGTVAAPEGDKNQDDTVLLRSFAITR